MFWKEIAVVFVGGGLGSIIRYLMGRYFSTLNLLVPLGTFSANLIACFIFGMASGAVFANIRPNNMIRMFILTGFCGGLSTFSTFNYEVYQYFKCGNIFLGVAYILASLISCLFSFVIAYYIFSK